MALRINYDFFKVISSFNSYYENCTFVFKVSIRGFEATKRLLNVILQWQ